MATRIEILDSNLNLLTWIKAPYELDKSGSILQYSKELSDFGQCKFRVSSYDPMFGSAQLGDILKPHSNHIRINRDGYYIWQGAIIENTKRTKDFIEVVAAEYLWYLGKKLIHRTSANPNGTGNDGIYRIFSSGTMATAVTAIMNETIADFQSTNHALASLSLGTVENPDYPPNMEDGNSPANKLTGPWSFGNGTNAPQLTFDFQTVLYVLKSFGQYTYADFNIDSNLKFNFEKFLGKNNQYSVNFVWGKHGNAVDFNFPRLGQMMTNDLWGIAVGTDGTVYHTEQTDEPSIKTNGQIEAVAAYADIKDLATLNARVAAELPLVSQPEESPVNMVLSEKAYSLGVYDIGDIINAQINHTAVQLREIKRIVGISVNLHNTGRELTTVQLNTPLPWQYGSA